MNSQSLRLFSALNEKNKFLNVLGGDREDIEDRRTICGTNWE
jgi:hypothetical protein